ncbi:MAG: 2-hydroxyacyl-CoA dehydratase family protein, partial [Clostridiales bacterium]|nr:2-hydroxyacyl-CoA dehydratase family protein [Clostridiales bacterium]
MTKIETLCKELREIAANPGKSTDALKAKTGKKLVGMGPVYSPEEIAIAAGAIPIGIWGGQKSIQKARAELPPFVCSIMQSVKELELAGAYDNLDAVIFTSLCDTLKNMGQKWKGKAPLIQFAHPQMRVMEASNVYLAEEYRHVAARLEKALGVKITEDKLTEAIEICNANRVALQ